MSEDPPAPEIRDVPPPPPPDSSSDTEGPAQAEATAFTTGNLEQEAAHATHRRREQFRDHFSWGALAILWLLMFGAGFSLFAVGWHFLMPTCWSWLNEDQLSTIRTFITSALGVGLVGEYFRRNLGQSN